MSKTIQFLCNYSNVPIRRGMLIGEGYTHQLNFNRRESKCKSAIICYQFISDHYKEDGEIVDKWLTSLPV